MAYQNLMPRVCIRRIWATEKESPENNTETNYWYLHEGLAFAGQSQYLNLDLFGRSKDSGKHLTCLRMYTIAHVLDMDMAIGPL